MPNWCEGTLKVRGIRADLEKFVLEVLKPVSQGDLSMDEYGRVISDKRCWIKGTTKGYVDGVNVYFSDMSDDDEMYVVFFESRFANAIKPEELLEISKKYDVDMRIYAFERGMHFNQVVEIVDGEMIQDYVKHIDDYDWECICPGKGG